MRKQEFNSKHLPTPAQRGSRSRTASPPAPLANRKGRGRRRGTWRSRCLKKIVRLASAFLHRPFGLPTSQGRGGLGCMDSTLALGAFRIARDAGGEAVDVSGNLVERGKGD